MKSAVQTALLGAIAVLLAGILFVLWQISETLPARPMTVAEWKKADPRTRNGKILMVEVANTVDVSGRVEISGNPIVDIGSMPAVEIDTRTHPVRVTPDAQKGLPVRVEK